MSTDTIPVITATSAAMKSRRWETLDHYLIAPYASTEQHYQRIVVVDPSIAEPTWLLRAGTSKPAGRNIMALIVPDLTALTYELAAAHTRIVTDYIGVRVWSPDDRKAGKLWSFDMPLIAEKITADGPVLRAQNRCTA